jgi:L-fuculose-phosphate aldolase
MKLDKSELQLRRSIVEKARWMNASGLNQGTSGNISARCGDRMLITPSAVPYEALKPSMLAAMSLHGKGGPWDGPLRPSTEWRFHLDILRDRQDAGAIVHTHSTFATVLSIARRSIPACHYMIAAFGGADIRCADYARPGSEALSETVLQALAGRSGCLLANHGALAVGANLDRAMWLAEALETVAKQYYYALLIGGPVVLSDSAVDDVQGIMRSYGSQDCNTTPQPSPVRAKTASRARG